MTQSQLFATWVLILVSPALSNPQRRFSCWGALLLGGAFLALETLK